MTALAGLALPTTTVASTAAPIRLASGITATASADASVIAVGDDCGTQGHHARCTLTLIHRAPRRRATVLHYRSWGTPASAAVSANGRAIAYGRLDHRGRKGFTLIRGSRSTFFAGYTPITRTRTQTFDDSGAHLLVFRFRSRGTRASAGVLDLRTHRFTPLPVGPAHYRTIPVAISSDGQTVVYTASRFDHPTYIYALDRPTSRVTPIGVTAPGTYYFPVSADAHILILPDEFRYSESSPGDMIRSAVRVDWRTRQAEQVPVLPAFARAVSTDRDGSNLLVECGGDAYLYSFAAETFRRVLRTSYSDLSELQLTADGNNVTFRRSSPHDLAALLARTTNDEPALSTLAAPEACSTS